MASIVVHLMLAFVLLTHAAGQVDVKIADNLQTDRLECTVTINLSTGVELEKIIVTKNINTTYDKLITAVPNDTQNITTFSQAASVDACFYYDVNQTTKIITYVLNVGVASDRCQLKVYYIFEAIYVWKGRSHVKGRGSVPECKEPTIRSIEFTRLEQVLISVSVVLACVSIVIPATAFFRKHATACISTRSRIVRERSFTQVEVTTDHEMEHPHHIVLTDQNTANPLLVIDIHREQRCPVPARGIQGERHYYSPVTDIEDNYHHYTPVLDNQDDYHHYTPVVDNVSEQDYSTPAL